MDGGVTFCKGPPARAPKPIPCPSPDGPHPPEAEGGYVPAPLAGCVLGCAGGGEDVALCCR